MTYRQICLVLLLLVCLPVTSSVHAGSKTPQKKYYKLFKNQYPKASCPDISQVCKLAAFTVARLVCDLAMDEAWGKDKPKDFEVIKSEVINKLWPPICGPIPTYEDSEGKLIDNNIPYFVSFKWCKDNMTTIIEEKEKKGKETEKTESGTDSVDCPVCPEPEKNDCGGGPLVK